MSMIGVYKFWKVGNISSKCMLGLDFESEKHDGLFLGQRKQDILHPKIT